MDQSGEWYVLFCKSRREQQVCSVLDSKGFETFHPTQPVRTSPNRAPLIQSFFPRYLFVRADLDAIGTSGLEWIPGAIGLVKYGDIPAQVPPHVVEQLKQRLAEMRARGGLAAREMQRGEAVHIVRGPLAGYQAMFDERLSGSERVRVLLRLLGRQVRVDLNINAIESKRSLH